MCRGIRKEGGGGEGKRRRRKRVGRESKVRKETDGKIKRTEKEGQGKRGGIERLRRERGRQCTIFIKVM